MATITATDRMVQTKHRVNCRWMRAPKPTRQLLRQKLLYRNRTGNFSTASPRAGRNPVCLKPKPEDLPRKVVAPAMDDGWRKNRESGGFPCFIVPFGNFCSERFSFLKQENCWQIKFVNCGSPCCGSALTKRAERTVIRYEENRKKTVCL